jgi:pyruvate, water dikinase
MVDLDIYWLSELSKEDVQTVGEKAAYLAELYNQKLPVPNAFVIGPDFFNQVISDFQSQIDQYIQEVSDLKTAYDASANIKQLLSSISFTEEIKNKLLNNYKKINEHPDHENMSALTRQLVTSGRDLPFLAVRMSLVKNYPFQFKPVLNVYGSDMLIVSIKQLIVSFFSPPAIYYRYKKNINYAEISVPILIQKMVYAVKSGDLFTLNPITNKKSELYVQAIWGINSEVFEDPSVFVFDKQTNIITSEEVSSQDNYYTKNGQFGELFLEPLPSNLKQMKLLSENDLKILLDLSQRVENIMNFPQHIEWTIDKRSVQIIQTRPITRVFEKPLIQCNNGVLIQQNNARGSAVSILSAEDLQKVRVDNIIVTSIANRTIFPYLIQSTGYVCNSKGITSPLVQFCKDFTVPAIFKAKGFESISDGQEIQFNGTSCEIVQPVQIHQPAPDYSQNLDNYSSYSNDSSESNYGSTEQQSNLSNIKQQFEQLERSLTEQVSKEAQKRATGEHTSEEDHKKSQLISELEWQIRNLRRKLD